MKKIKCILCIAIIMQLFAANFFVSFADEKGVIQKINKDPILQLVVNGIKVTPLEGIPFMSNGARYVPLEATVTKMGDGYSYDVKTQTAKVTVKSGQEFYIVANEREFFTTGSCVPYVMGKIGTITEPEKIKAILKDDILYVPFVFVTQYLKYRVMIVEDTIYFGMIPPPENPIIKSTVTKSKIRNMQILDEELGFVNIGGGAIFNPYEKSEDNIAILISSDEDEDKEASITYYGWSGGPSCPEYNKVRPISKELFKFYFPKSYENLFNKVEKFYKDKSLLNKRFVLDNREVEFRYVNDLIIFIGKPGVKYTYGWKVKK